MGDTMKEAFEKAGLKSEQKNKASSSPSKPADKKGKITLDKDYPARADRVIQDFRQEMGRNYNQFTTSKIRNILAKVSEIYNDVSISQNELLDSDIQNRIAYLKVRLIYECGREPRVIKPFVEKAGLLDLLDGIGNDRQRLIDFAHYMEALVAYHRFYGGSDK